MNTDVSNQLLSIPGTKARKWKEIAKFRACLHAGGGPQIGEVTWGGSPHLSCKRDQIKMRDYMDRGVTSPTWGPPPPGKQALTNVAAIQLGPMGIMLQKWVARNLHVWCCCLCNIDKEVKAPQWKSAAMVALLVFIMAILEIFGRKNNCWR